MYTMPIFIVNMSISRIKCIAKISASVDGYNNNYTQWNF